MVLTFDLLGLVDARIRSNDTARTVMGTVTSDPDNTLQANVQIDGSGLSIPVKVFGNVRLLANDRVGLMRFGSEWVIVGCYTYHSWLIGEHLEPNSSITAYTTETFYMTLTLSKLLAGVRYRVSAGNFEFAVSSGSNQANLLLRYAAGASVTSSGTLFSQRDISHQLVDCPTGIDGTFVAPSTGQFTVGVSTYVWTGVAPGVFLGCPADDEAYLRCWET